MNALLDKLRAMQPMAAQTHKPLPKRQTGSVPAELELQLQTTPHGEYWIREKVFYHQDWSGLEVIPLLTHDDFVRIGKNIALATMDPFATVLIDTETTGLAGGAGTYAFLVGVAFIQPEKIVVRQYFMQEFSQEPALLFDLAKDLAESTGLITFNGKAYDIPLLRNRVVMNRVAMDWNRFVHLDLLHAARRLWRPFTRDCRLNSMEETILGFHRQNDVAGELIPSLYFTSLQTHDLTGLKPVFQHNALDLLSLARLVGKAAEIFRGVAQIPFHRLGVARTLQALRLYQQAGEICSAADETDQEENLRLCLCRAENLKRLQRFQEAETIWLQLLQEKQGFSLQPFLELIKYYEHRKKDLQAALTMVVRATERVQLQIELYEQTEHALILDELRTRERRIRAKKEKWIKRNGVEI